MKKFITPKEHTTFKLDNLNIQVRQNYFEGDALAEYLPTELRLQLGVSADNVVQIVGSFEIAWDGGEPMPQIDSIAVWFADRHIEVEIELINYEYVESIIAQYDDGTWAEDRLGRMIDDATDRFND